LKVCMFYTAIMLIQLHEKGLNRTPMHGRSDTKYFSRSISNPRRENYMIVNMIYPGQLPN